MPGLFRSVLFAFALAVLGLAVAPVAGAVPVDVSDPSLRAILVGIESSSCNGTAGLADPAAERASCLTMASDPGAVFDSTVAATFEVLAGVATVTIAGAAWEQILFLSQGQSDGVSLGIVANTTSDAVLSFDAVTGMPLSWGWTSEIIVTFLGQIPLAGVLAAEPNDVYFASVFGNDVALNCDAVPGAIPAPPVAPQCTGTPVNHIAYNPLTGTISALGGVGTGIVREAWGPADWLLSEVPEPASALLLGPLAAALVLFRSRRRPS